MAMKMENAPVPNPGVRPGMQPGMQPGMGGQVSHCSPTKQFHIKTHNLTSAE